jgi:hypothetical protein
MAAMTVEALHVVSGRRGRSVSAGASLALRARVRLTRGSLDGQIADKRPYGFSATLLLRARQLTHPRTRRRVARELRRSVEHADRVGARPAVSRFIVAGSVVLEMAARDAILALADRLEGPVSVCPRGVVLARMLLADGLRGDLVNPWLGPTVAESVWGIADVLVWAHGRETQCDGVLG